MAIDESAMPTVLVMMATYNGEKYISEQIDSILEQEDVAVYLLISDDGSTDNTCALCRQYAADYENVYFRRNEANKGLALNFMDMVYVDQFGDYDYYAFSDQDDYWLPEKLKKAIGALQCAGNAATPRLYFSDVLNVDGVLRSPTPEFLPFKKIANRMKPLLTCNYASGCTMVFNASLRKLLVGQQPESYPRNHDAWVYLVALACGEVCSDLDNSYIYRRITGKNQVGERDFGNLSFGRISDMLKNMFKGPDEETVFRVTAIQLKRHCSGLMSEENCAVLDDFIGSHNSFAKRLKLALDPEYIMPSLIDTLALKARLLLRFY